MSSKCPCPRRYSKSIKKTISYQATPQAPFCFFFDNQLQHFQYIFEWYILLSGMCFFSRSDQNHQQVFGESWRRTCGRCDRAGALSNSRCCGCDQKFQTTSIMLHLCPLLEANLTLTLEERARKQMYRYSALTKVKSRWNFPPCVVGFPSLPDDP